MQELLKVNGQLKNNNYFRLSYHIYGSLKINFHHIIGGDLMNIRDVANLAGVGVSTVSKVIKNKHDV